MLTAMKRITEPPVFLNKNLKLQHTHQQVPLNEPKPKPKQMKKKMKKKNKNKKRAEITHNRLYSIERALNDPSRISRIESALRTG